MLKISTKNKIPSLLFFEPGTPEKQGLRSTDYAKQVGWLRTCWHRYINETKRPAISRNYVTNRAFNRNLTGEQDLERLSTNRALSCLFGILITDNNKDRHDFTWPLDWSFISTLVWKSAERNSTKLDRKQDLNVLFQVCVFFGPIGKTRWPPWALIVWDIFDFFSETAEWNSTKLDRKQDLNRPLPSLCFSGRSEKQDGRPGLWLDETFSTSSLKPLNRIQGNLIGGKISMSSTKFAFLGADRKNKLAALASDWLRHFWLLLWNHWTEFNETW